MQKRPSWDEYFTDLVVQVARRATCDRGRSGCVVVRDKQILCTGYVGSPPSLEHCDDVGHLLKNVTGSDGVTRQHCVRTIHAEQNAIAQAARHGISLDGSTFYCSMEPCRTCAMLIVSVGASRVVARAAYHAAEESRLILAAAGIQLEVLDSSPVQYADQLVTTPNGTDG